MSRLIGPERRCTRDSAAATRGYLLEHTCGSRREDNDALLAPRSTAGQRGIRQFLSRTAVHVNAFQLALRKEAQVVRIRRPEGKLSILRPDQRLCRKGAKRSHVYRLNAFAICRNKGELSSIRGEDRYS